MFKVEMNKQTKIINAVEGIIFLGIFVAMVVLFQDMYASFSGIASKIVASIIYIGIMIFSLFLVYYFFDNTFACYMIVESRGFRIKHLFRKEITLTPDQITKWKCYTQYLKNGQNSENIVIYYGDRSEIEFGIYECTNFERLLHYLKTNYKTKRN